MIEKTNRCSHCAQCIRCGRNTPYLAAFCDECRQEIDGRVYRYDGLELCRDCVLERLESFEASDLDQEEVQICRTL